MGLSSQRCALFISRFDLLVHKFFEVCLVCNKFLVSEVSLHVVLQGTKGKGSTSSFTERILRQAGLRTGLYTSPHLIDVRERIRINGRMLDQEAFARHFWAVHDKLSGFGPAHELHFFHFLTVLGFYIFQQVCIRLLNKNKIQIATKHRHRYRCVLSCRFVAGES